MKDQWQRSWHSFSLLSMLRDIAKLMIVPKSFSIYAVCWFVLKILALDRKCCPQIQRWHRCYLSFTFSLFGDVFEQCIDNRFNFLTLEWQELKFIISLRMSVNFWRIRQIKCQSNTTRLLPTIIGFNPPPSHPSLQRLFQANAFRQRGPRKWHFRR